MISPIGVFDSGVGGLSVLRSIRSLLPSQPIIYLADQAHVPYGTRTLQEVRILSEGITRFLLSQGASLIVIACNTASAAALHPLRQIFAGVPFVGMEPAVKPAAQHTRSKIIGVLATPATFQGELYSSIIERFAQGITILQDTCPGLVSQVEAGELDTPKTRAILERAVSPMLQRNVDTLVMGCTHYPFIIPLLRSITGNLVEIIDPSPAVALQVERVIKYTQTQETQPPGKPQVSYITTGDPKVLQRAVPDLLGEDVPTVGKAHWDGTRLLVS